MTWRDAILGPVLPVALRVAELLVLAWRGLRGARAAPGRSALCSRRPVCGCPPTRCRLRDADPFDPW